ncbi:MAG TPA: dihydroneopterin aldolase [Aliicoccus persicus]|uniref:7,8-dihydroneopterin aldolase n=1 Tax=Aliicoccus persicus TaxID=930138 RepID=A0A921DWT4_9STAP|nr:dihydroneopterin aldolase [Aliicoccus persicus]
MDIINVNGIKVYGYHGALNAEREIGQYFIIDVSLYLDLMSASKTDALDETINYAEVYQLIETDVKNNPVNLIEHLGGRIIEQLFATYDKINEIKLTVTKPSPPIDGHYDNVSVTLNRKRVS